MSFLTNVTLEVQSNILVRSPQFMLAPQCNQYKKHTINVAKRAPYSPPPAGVARFSGPGVDVLHIGSSGLKLSPASCLLSTISSFPILPLGPLRRGTTEEDFLRL